MEDWSAFSTSSLASFVTWGFFLYFFLIYISNVIPFPLPNHLPLLPPALTLPYTVGSRLLLLLVANKAIFWYICSWRHGSVHVNPLDGGLVPGSSGWLTLLLWGLQTPSAPSILSLTLPMVTPFSTQWLAASIHFCICHALVEPLRRKLCQAPFNMHFLASAVLCGFSGCMYMDWIPMWGRHWMAIPSVSPPNFVSISSPTNIFVPLLRRMEASALCSSFFLSFMCSVDCILDIPRILANIQLLVTACHVYVFCFVFLIGLPHSGWYFLVPFIRLWISWSHWFTGWVVLHCVDVPFSASNPLLKDILVLSSFWQLWT